MMRPSTAQLRPHGGIDIVFKETDAKKSRSAASSNAENTPTIMVYQGEIPTTTGEVKRTEGKLHGKSILREQRIRDGTNTEVEEGIFRKEKGTNSIPCRDHVEISDGAVVEMAGHRSPVQYEVCLIAIKIKGGKTSRPPVKVSSLDSKYGYKTHSRL